MDNWTYHLSTWLIVAMSLNVLTHPGLTPRRMRGPANSCLKAGALASVPGCVGYAQHSLVTSFKAITVSFFM